MMTRIFGRTCNMPVRKRDNDYHTYADYYVWSRTWGDELIQGTAYVREPAPTFWHQLIVGEIYRQVANALQTTSWRVCISPLDVRLPRSNERDEDCDRNHLSAFGGRL